MKSTVFSATRSEYQSYLETLKKMRYQANEYVPNQDEIQRILMNPAKYMGFLIWIDKTGYRTEENAEIRQEIKEIITEHFVIVEDPEP